MTTYDYGDTWSPLEDFLKNKTDPIFPFLRYYKELENLQVDDATESLADFIYLSNRIEDCGTESRQETYNSIVGLTHNPDVTSTLNALNYASENLKNGFDVKFLCNIHSFLLTDAPGVLRKGGAFTFVEHKSKNHYPHHSYVEKAIVKYCDIVQTLIKTKGSFTYMFAVSVFAHYHLAKLHPFGDGNGRLCRIVSKIILDTYTNKSYPITVDKFEYFKALESDTLDPLFDLLYRAA